MSAKVLAFPVRAPVPAPEWASAPESAKLLKVTLRRAFPAVKFSVTLDRGTAYGCANVSWTDGPTTRRVEAVVSPFEGEGFDGSQDLAYSIRNTLPDGRRTGLRLISCNRHVSASLARKAAAQVAAFYGVPLPVIVQRDGSRYWEIEGGDSRFVRDDIREYWSTLIHRAASDRSQFARD